MSRQQDLGLPLAEAPQRVLETEDIQVPDPQDARPLPGQTRMSPKERARLAVVSHDELRAIVDELVQAWEWEMMRTQLVLLQDGPQTTTQLADLTCETRKLMLRFLHRMHEQGMVARKIRRDLHGQPDQWSIQPAGVHFLAKLERLSQQRGRS